MTCNRMVARQALREAARVWERKQYDARRINRSSAPPPPAQPLHGMPIR